MNQPEYSVVVPVFNSQESLIELFEGIVKAFVELDVDFETIFIDDRSTDNSWEVLQNLKQQHPQHVKIVRLSRNYGQHNATLCGLMFAKGEAVITIDDDLQTPPHEIITLVRAFEDSPCDVIYGIPYGKKAHHFYRNLGSFLVKKSSRNFRKTPGEGSSFRLLRRSITDKIVQHSLFFIFIDEILLWYTEDIRFVEVEHLPRKYNHSGYSFGKLWHLVTNLVVFYTDAPLKLMVYGGLFASFVSFILGVIYIVKKLFFNVPLGYTSLIVAILFSTSIILFSLGIIGEYLSRIYKVQNRKPPFSIDKVME